MTTGILTDPAISTISFGGDGQGGFAVEFTYRGFLFKRIGFKTTGEACAWVREQQETTARLPKPIGAAE